MSTPVEVSTGFSVLPKMILSAVSLAAGCSAQAMHRNSEDGSAALSQQTRRPAHAVYSLPYSWPQAAWMSDPNWVRTVTRIPLDFKMAAKALIRLRSGDR